MIKLSYTTANALINAPHTWLNKVNGLKTYSTTYFDEGKKAHSIIQRHVSDVENCINLPQLPRYNRVEKSELDTDMHITKEYKDILFHGYVDCISDERKEFADIKTGAKWSVAKMARHPQFWLYSWALGYNNFCLINPPRDPDMWNHKNIFVLSMTFTDSHHKKAMEFLDNAINTIKNITSFVANENFEKSRQYCFYVNCPYCHGNHY